MLGFEAASPALLAYCHSFDITLFSEPFRLTIYLSLSLVHFIFQFGILKYTSCLLVFNCVVGVSVLISLLVACLKSMLMIFFHCDISVL